MPLPAFWNPLLTVCHYVAILVATAAFGPKAGLAAAVLASIVHVAANTIACRLSISQQGEVAAFLAVGLLAGFLIKRTPTGTMTELSPPNPVKAGLQDREVSPNADALGRGPIPLGFVQAVRAPLSAIESAGYVLEDAALTDENHREVASIILRECHRLDVLIRPLEFVQTRLPAYREVEVSSILDDILRQGEPLTQAANITIRKENGCGLKLVCDSDLVEQAVLNLLANAIRVVGHGEEIVLSAHRDTNNAVIEMSHRRLGVLGQLGITMAAMPEGELQVYPRVGDSLLRPEVRTQ
jgi:hypothetical protein